LLNKVDCKSEMISNWRNSQVAVNHTINQGQGINQGHSQGILNQGQVSINQGRVTINQDQATINQDQVTINQGPSQGPVRRTTNQGQVTTNQGQVTTNQGQVTINQGHRTINQGHRTMDIKILPQTHHSLHQMASSNSNNSLLPNLPHWG